MSNDEWLAAQFEESRQHLSVVAYRMLGSSDAADDAVQESWIRLSRSNPSEVENLTGWLTTVVARVCLDILRSRRARREDQVGMQVPDLMIDPNAVILPDEEALLADSIGPALLVVLDTLSPPERVALVLHDMFGVPFDEVAQVIGRSPAATRQLGSRARRRVQGASESPAADPARQRVVVEAFLAASRNGDFEALLTLLDPDVVLRADSTAVAVGASEEVRGAQEVAETFSGRARVAKLALIDGDPGLVWAPGGRPKVVFALDVADGRIIGITMIADPDHLDRLDIEFPDS